MRTVNESLVRFGNYVKRVWSPSLTAETSEPREVANLSYSGSKAFQSSLGRLMRVAFKRIAWLAALSLPLIHSAQAQSASDWSVSGFGTLGFVDKSGGRDLEFLRSSTQVGADSNFSATPDSRLGLQLNWNPNSQWEAGAQVALISKPPGTRPSEILQYSYIGYRIWPNTRVRIGRNSPDIFLFADSRNVGFALPWVRPPADFYGFAPIVSIDGVDLEQRWSAGDSTWQARLTAGSLTSSVTASSGARIPLEGRDAFALSLARQEGGLHLKVSYLRSRLQVDGGAEVQQLRQGLDQLNALPVPGLTSTVASLEKNLWAGGIAEYLAVAAQYETGPWTLIAEGSQLRVPNSALKAKRGYASAGYRVGTVTYYGIASRVKPDQAAVTEPALTATLSPIVGLAAAQQAQALAGYAAAAGDGSRYDQSTLGAGLRWDFSSNAALKLQVDRFNIHNHGGAGWRNYDGRAARGTLVSVLVDFVWGQ